MATRFAGDFFGIPLTTEKEEGSVLIDYYPDLKTIKKSSSSTGQPKEEGGARSYGGAKAAPLFSGFREFEASGGERKAAPVFTGFKSYRTPAR